MCTRSEQGTRAHLWLGEHGGPDKVSHEAALVTGSNEVCPGQERCQSSTGLRNKIRHRSLSINLYK